MLSARAHDNHADNLCTRREHILPTEENDARLEDAEQEDASRCARTHPAAPGSRPPTARSTCSQRAHTTTTPTTHPLGESTHCRRRKRRWTGQDAGRRIRRPRTPPSPPIPSPPPPPGAHALSERTRQPRRQRAPSARAHAVDEEKDDGGVKTPNARTPGTAPAQTAAPNHPPLTATSGHPGRPPRASHPEHMLSARTHDTHADNASFRREHMLPTKRRTMDGSASRAPSPAPRTPPTRTPPGAHALGERTRHPRRQRILSARAHAAGVEVRTPE